MAAEGLTKPVAPLRNAWQWNRRALKLAHELFGSVPGPGAVAIAPAFSLSLSVTHKPKQRLPSNRSVADSDTQNFWGQVAPTWGIALRGTESVVSLS